LKDAVVYSTAPYDRFAAEFAHGLGAAIGRIERRSFPDGERYRRFETIVRMRDVVVVGGTISDADSLEIFDLGCTAVAEGARSLTLVIPYYGYSTMERAARSGEVVGAKTRARLLSAIPRAHTGNAALLLDLHTEGIPYYFGDAITARHVSARFLFVEAIAALGREELIVGSTDAGRAKWVQSIANDIGCPAAFVYKRRISGSESRITGVNADVAGKTVALYDDMLRTGGSMLQAAEAYREAGAPRVVAFCTHFLPAQNALDKLRSSGVIDGIITTDSHPSAPEKASEFVKVLPVASLLAEAASREGTA
jgi:ribose-phosphate pyrophosphokinase